MSDITDDTGNQNDVVDHSNSPSDVTSDSTKASKKPEIEKDDKTEPPTYMELKPRQESNTIYQSLQEHGNEPINQEPRDEHYMGLKPTVSTEYETLHHNKPAPEQDYEFVDSG
jgi:hypothetical protein